MKIGSVTKIGNKIMFNKITHYIKSYFVNFFIKHIRGIYPLDKIILN